jgi:enoyl-CoA hydratase/carnithine racemase
VVPLDELLRTVTELAGSLAARPRQTLKVTKEQIARAIAGEPDDEADADALLAALSDPEAMQAAEAYFAAQVGRD